MTRRSLLYPLLAASLLFAASAAGQEGSERRGRPGRPKLAIVIVLDQFRADNLTRYAAHFGEGGFKALTRGGANCTSAHYSHATTYTGPGHATIASGSYGHVNGIIGNRWPNPASGKLETMFFDPEAKLPGVALDPIEDDTSPRNFIGTSLGDQLRLATNRKSKVLGVALKDRAAIMLAGKLGQAYWFHEDTGGMLTSSYYQPQLPSWVAEFNARKIPDGYFNKPWDRYLPAAAYSASHPENQPWETDLKGLGRSFPHTLTDKSGKPGPDFYTAFTATPFGTDYTLQFARTAIEKEGLGQDEYPDLLGISITPTDITGHAYGPYSQEYEDVVLRADEQLAQFFDYLNARFKKGEVLIALTADHGACAVPEYLQSLGLDAGRIKRKELGDKIEGELTRRFGPPDGEARWVTLLEDPAIYLNRALIAARKLDPAEVEAAAGEAAMQVRGLSRFFTRTQLLNGQLSSKWAAMFEKSFYPQRSGDVFLMTRPYSFWGSYGDKDTGATHGSPYEYDTHVPLLFSGPGVRPGAYSQSVDVADLAPTLAALLDVDAPPGCEGRPIEGVLGQQ